MLLASTSAHASHGLWWRELEVSEWSKTLDAVVERKREGDRWEWRAIL